MKLNPVVQAYDFKWGLLFEKPLDQIEGMANGVREDIETGYMKPGGFRGNLCVDSAHTPICYWRVKP